MISNLKKKEVNDIYLFKSIKERIKYNFNLFSFEN